MSTPPTGRGGRLPLLAPEDLSGAARDLRARIGAEFVPWADAAGFRSEAADGRLLGPFNAVLFSPEIGGAFLAWQSAEGAHTRLDERTRQVVILSVGAVWAAAYELYAHGAAARKAGLGEATVARLTAGDADPALTAREGLAQRFALALARDRRVDDRLYADAKAAFGDRGLVDMVQLIGAYQCVCGMLNAFAIPAPE